MSVPHGEPSNHKKYMQLALDEARKSPPKPTNFCVGACLVSQTLSPSESEDDHLTRNTTLLVTGFTLECPGNTHAEQSCFIKLAAQYGCTPETLGEHLPPNTALALYTTMEPCNRRSPGNKPCVDRILAIRRENGDMAIKQVYVGVTEPETFVGINEGRQKIEAAGIEVIHVPGLEKEILAVATSGHIKDESS